MSEPRYNMKLDFGTQGTSTTDPMTWRSLRKTIIEELNRAHRPEHVKLEVTRSKIPGSRP